MGDVVICGLDEYNNSPNELVELTSQRRQFGVLAITHLPSLSPYQTADHFGPRIRPVQTDVDQ